MKKYIVTGSIGNISRNIINSLVAADKEVLVITSSFERSEEIEKLGAKALLGSVNDAQFIKEAFAGADVVYTMIPPNWQTDNWRVSQNAVARNYIEAIKANEIKYVVNLSSVGADKPEGNGPVNGLHDFEQLLNQIPGLHAKHLRPSFFYYNFLSQIPMIKQAGIMGGNYGDGEKLFLVHTNDIADAASEELLNLNFTGSSVRYIYGDERSGSEVADVLGKSIGKELSWVVFSDKQQLDGLLQAGVPQTHAENFTEMGKGLREGSMQEDARINKPSPAKIKLEDFAKEFAQAFNN